MQANLILVFSVLIAAIIVGGLSFYAASLLLKVKKQQQRRLASIEHRIARITESIQTISMAMEQQQCNFSEGCIRLANLLSSVPIANQPDYVGIYPALHELYGKVSNLPTHEARKLLSASERRRQDIQREEDEAALESKILVEVSRLKHFTV